MSKARGWRPPWKRRDNALLAAYLSGPENLAAAGYVRLMDCPAIQSAVGGLADIISNATIQLMRNTEAGDVRIKDGLARFIDIGPWRHGSRKGLVQWIVVTMLTDSHGSAFVLPHSEAGYLTELEPMPGAYAVTHDRGQTYEVLWRGRAYPSDSVLHFVYRPDPAEPWNGMGLTASLQEVSRNLRQASKTRRGFLADKWKPPLIVRVNADAGELADESGRKKIRDAYLADSESGAPWILPADLMDVSQVKPLSLNDLAIADNVAIDSKAVASIVGVTPYMVGAGNYNAAEHNNMIRTTATSISNIIAQELTRKLLWSDDLYFKFSTRRLYSYSMQELSTVGSTLFVRGIMTGNEVRDWVELSPKDGLDELVVLENYIPLDRIGDQKKLNEGGEN